MPARGLHGAAELPEDPEHVAPVVLALGHVGVARMADRDLGGAVDAPEGDGRHLLLAPIARQPDPFPACCPAHQNRLVPIVCNAQPENGRPTGEDTTRGHDTAG